MENNIAVKLAEKVQEKGGCAYYVGGCVRDRILGIVNKDIDIEVHGVSVPDLEDILDGLGTRMEIGKSFGVYNLKGYDIDIALPRRERLIGTGHRDFEVTADPLMGTKEASKRRDFTINAMMEDILSGEIIDHFGGRHDLSKKILRHIDDDTFVEDPLRVLRAAQFAARFGLEIAPETLELCKGIDLSTLSRERVLTEMEKALLKAERPSVFFDKVREMEQLDVWFPEIKELIGVPQNIIYHQEGDVWIHTMMVIDEAAKRRDEAVYPLGFMMSALCHDLGKSVATVEVDGIFHAYEHEIVGLPIVKTFLQRLTNEKRLIAYVLNMTEFHMKPNKLAYDRSRIKSTNKLFDEAVEPLDLIKLAACDAKGKIPRAKDSEPFLTERYNLFKEIMSKPYVRGEDLIEAGFTPEKSLDAFKEIMSYAHKLRLADVPKEAALKQVLAYGRKL